MSYVVYVLDTETTGLESSINDVIEVSFCRLKLDKPNEFEQKTWNIKAVNAESITDKALQINGHKKEDILHFTKEGKEKYLEPSVAISQIENWIADDDVSIKDRAFVAQNVSFDWDMLKGLWNRAGCESTFPFGNFKFDTIEIAKLIDLISGNHRERYNLASLVKDFGITKRNAHRAADDAEMAKDLFIQMLSYFHVTP